MTTQARRLALICLLLALPVATAIAQEGNYRLGKVLGLRYFTITQGEAATYEQRVKEFAYPHYDRHWPGVDWVLLKGDRGEQDGEYAFFSNFETLGLRNYYYPQEEGPFPRTEPMEEIWNAEVADHFSEFEFEDTFVGDYVLVGAETVSEMPWIDLIGIHHLNVTAGEEEAFEQFVTDEWNRKAHCPGVWILIYKADRGERNGEYAMVYAFEQRTLRDLYFPNEGEDPTPEAERAFSPLLAVWTEIQANFLDDPPESEYTDFVLVR